MNKLCGWPMCGSSISAYVQSAAFVFHLRSVAEHLHKEELQVKHVLEDNRAEWAEEKHEWHFVQRYCLLAIRRWIQVTLLVIILIIADFKHFSFAANIGIRWMWLLGSCISFALTAFRTRFIISEDVAVRFL